MKNLVILALTLPFADACALGDDDFEVRRTAEARLVSWGELAAPALAWGALHPDLEIRLRCRRCAADALSREVDLFVTVTALWLFYGPPDGCDDLPQLRLHRWDLCRNENLVNRWPDWMLLALHARAVSWGLVDAKARPGMNVGERSSWVNEARRRVRGVR